MERIHGNGRREDKVKAVHLSVFPTHAWCAGARDWSIQELRRVRTVHIALHGEDCQLMPARGRGLSGVRTAHSSMGRSSMERAVVVKRVLEARQVAGVARPQLETKLVWVQTSRPRKPNHVEFDALRPACVKWRRRRV